MQQNQTCHWWQHTKARNRVMRNMAIFAAIVCLFTLTVLSFASCDYKDLEEDMSARTQIHLNFDWNKVDSIPKSMRVIFYPDDSYLKSIIEQGYVTFDVYSSGMDVALPSGTYKMTAFNNDTEHVFVNNQIDHNGIFATTSASLTRTIVDAETLLDSIYSQKILDYPDYMVHTSSEEVIIKGDRQTVTLTPDSMVVRVDFRVDGVTGLEHVQQIKAVMGNIAGKRFVTPDDVVQDTCAVLFDCGWDADNNSISAQFHVWSVLPNYKEQDGQKLTLLIWMKDSKVYLPIDLTDIYRGFRKNDLVFDINIKDTNINLNEFLPAQSGFEIDITEWEDIRIDVNF